MKNMLLVSSKWDDLPTFKMIPVSLECPFIEVIFDPKQKILAIISKTPKQSFQMVSKLDDNGDLMMAKGKSRPSGKPPYKEERKLLDTFHEYYLESEHDIRLFVNMFSVDAVDINSFFKKNEPPPGQITLTGKMEAVKME